jgi:uncharacterized protein (DUF1778 family)
MPTADPTPGPAAAPGYSSLSRLREVSERSRHQPVGSYSRTAQEDRRHIGLVRPPGATVLRSRSTLVCMAKTLTIRLDADDRAELEAAAREQGKGLSAFVRDIAEAEARRMRREAIRADGDRVVAHLAQHPEARRELDELGTPLTELP